MRLALLLVILGLFPEVNAQQNQALSTAEALVSQQRYGQAEMVLLCAAETNSDPELKDKLGEVYAYQGKWDEAIAIYQELSRRRPDSVEYTFKYGGALAKKAQKSNKLIALTLLGRIKTSFKKVLQLDPDHIRGHWALVDLYVSLPGIVGGSNSKAMDYAEKLANISPLEGVLARAYVYEYDNQTGKAKILYLNALQSLNETDGTYRNPLRYQIGKICSDYGEKIDFGIAQMHKYIAAYTPLDGVPLEWAYFRLAKLYRKKGDRTSALKNITSALELREGFKPALEEKKKILAL